MYLSTKEIALSPAGYLNAYLGDAATRPLTTAVGIEHQIGIASEIGLVVVPRELM